MMRTLSAVGLCTIALVTSSCSPERASRPGLALPSWSVQGPEVRIGSVNDPAYAFGAVRALAVAPNGFLYSLHANEASVRVWTPDGHPADSIGREGEGPGEFRSPWSLGFFGDTLWVADFGTFRASYFRSDGTFLGTSAPSVDLGGSVQASPPRPMRPLRDGTWYGETPAFSDPIARGTLTEGAHVHMDAEGHVLDTIWVQHYRKTDILALLNKGRPGGAYGQQPFRDAPLYWVLDDGRMVVADRRVPESATGATVDVTEIAASGDTLWRDTIPYTPTPLPKARVDSVVAAQAGSWFGFLKRTSQGVTRAGAEAEIRAAMYAPPFVPFLKGLQVSSDGSVWLQETEGASDGEAWLVLDPHGQPTARVVTPAGLRVVLVHGDDLWGVETDSLGVNYIVRYGIRRGGA